MPSSSALLVLRAALRRLRDEGARIKPIPDKTAPAGAPNWDAIKEDFVHSGLSLARLSERHGVSAPRISRRAEKDGWARLVPVRPLARSPKSKAAAPRKPAKTAQRGELVRRLLEALDNGLTQLEARMTPPTNASEPQSAANAERDARILNGLARLYAKLVALDDETRRKEKRGEESAKTEVRDDADKLRQELALRLQRLNQAREPR